MVFQVSGKILTIGSMELHHSEDETQVQPSKERDKKCNMIIQGEVQKDILGLGHGELGIRPIAPRFTMSLDMYSATSSAPASLDLHRKT
jgi:hypothetical protein